MQTRLQRIWLVMAVAILGCDARASEDYRGEPLLSLSGKLLFKNPRVPDGVVPALAFVDGAEEPKWHLLDVDVRGEFPTNFTLDVMSPPPAAAMRAVAGVPSYALALVAAVPADHGPALILPAEYDGAGTFSWCENIDTDCYRTIELCVKGTDNCYRERARCKHVPIENSDATWEECDEILEHSGDPEIAFPFNSFAGVSANYVLLYVAAEAPAGASRAYLLDEWSASSVPSGAFGKNAIPSGYHLIQVRRQTAAEQAAGDACLGPAEAESYASFNAEHGTNVTPENMLEQLPGGVEDPLYKELLKLQLDASWAASCGNGLVYTRLDPASTPIELTIGTRDLALIW